MLNPFVCVRNKIRDAVVQGFCDGVEAIEQGDTEQPAVKLSETLTRRLALPAGEPNGHTEEPTRKRK